MTDPRDPNIWEQVFSPLGGALAFFGMLGALVRSLVLREAWRETLRVVAIGAIVAFGLGTISPHVLRWIIGPGFPTGVDVGATLGIFFASAFLIGLIAVGLVERFIETSRGGKSDPDQT